MKNRDNEIGELIQEKQYIENEKIELLKQIQDMKSKTLLDRKNTILNRAPTMKAGQKDDQKRILRELEEARMEQEKMHEEQQSL